MIFRHWKAICGAMLLSASASLMGAPAHADPAYVMKVSTTVTRPFDSYALLDHLAVRVKELTNGEVEVQVLQPFATERDQFEQVLLGQLQGQASSVDTFGQWVLEARVAGVPMFYAGWDEVWKVLDGPIGEMIAEKAADHGFKVFGFISAGQRDIITKRPIENIDDLKGMKIRILNSPIWTSFYQSLGSIPVPMDWSDIYTSLQTGIIDGVDGGIGGSFSAKQHEVAKYAVALGHAYQVQIFVTSAAWWETLPPEHQAAIEQAVQEGIPLARQATVDAQAQAIENWRNAGGTVIEPDDGFREAVASASNTARSAAFDVIGGETVIKAVEDALRN